MTAIQAALLVAAITVLTKLPVGSLEYCLVFALATLGCLTSFAWGSMIRRTRSFLELSVRTLRNLEAELGEYGVPLQYFTLESHIFGPKPFSDRGFPLTEMTADGKNGIVSFTSSKEQFPDSEGPFRKPLAKSGGIILDARLATVALVVWLLAVVIDLLFLFGIGSRVGLTLP